MTLLFERSTISCTGTRFGTPALALIALLACGLAAGCGKADCEPTGLFGSCCRADAGCPADLACLDRFPGGLCSRECVRDTDCPAEGSCVRIVSGSAGDLGTVCLLRCGAELPACRADYACRQTSDPDLRICFPD